MGASHAVGPRGGHIGTGEHAAVPIRLETLAPVAEALDIEMELVGEVEPPEVVVELDTRFRLDLESVRTP